MMFKHDSATENFFNEVSILFIMGYARVPKISQQALKAKMEKAKGTKKHSLAMAALTEAFKECAEHRFNQDDVSGVYHHRDFKLSYDNPHEEVVAQLKKWGYTVVHGEHDNRFYAIRE